MTLLNSFPHLATIQRRTVTQDEGGEAVTLWEDLSTSVAAWFQPFTTQELGRMGTRYTDVTHRVFLTTDPGISGDIRRIIWVDNGNVSMMIRGVRDATAGLSKSYVVMATEDKIDLEGDG